MTSVALRFAALGAAGALAACGYPTTHRRPGSDVVVGRRAQVRVRTAPRESCGGQPGTIAIERTCVLAMPDTLRDAKRDATEPPRPTP